MITKEQIKKIHTMKNLLGLDDELYREILMKFKAKSCKDLSKEQAKKLIDILEVNAIGFKGKFNELSNRANMATPAQLRRIEAMWVEFLKIADNKEVIDKSKSKKSLRKLLQRLYKISDLRFLPREKVPKVLKTIQTMINQKLNSN
ncbi:MAG TPA: DUF1018 domain-containing protein [Candidatus Gastranaerophilales bacterium]|nr:DUF1018 domain-containing protein [Candidatus Gastranaerophilales bacterium]